MLAANCLILFFVGLSLAAGISPDATCGGPNGHTCLGSGFGDCCSTHGWCGYTDAYCNLGCQSEFGSCASQSESSTSSSTPQVTMSVSHDGSCGESSKMTCKGSTFGNCCSVQGWCGSSDAYCGQNCQTDFGSCTPSESSKTISVETATSKSMLIVSTDSTCGGDSGFTCKGSGFGDCCSEWGWCGSSSNYCDSGCQVKYGTCSVSASSSVSSASTSAVPTASLAECLANKDVPASMPQGPLAAEFDTLSEPYNVRLSYTPAVIVLPTTLQHISDAVVCAKANNLKVQPRGGGHSYASYAFTGEDGNMVIDLRSFQNVTVDDQGIAAVGGGLRLGNLALAIFDQGQRALPHGTCPGVGVGGHVTHGGYGYDSRTWGLAMDTIVALDVVIEDGSMIHATESEHPDLYWALRGAADSFGIVVTFYFQTLSAPSTVINFSFGFSGMFSNKQNFVQTLFHLQEFGQNASVVDRNLGFGIYMDGSGFSVGGTYIGSLSDFDDKIRPEMLRGLPAPSSVTVNDVGWIESLTLLGGDDTLVTTENYIKQDNFFAKSLTLPESSPPSLEVWGDYWEYIVGNSPPSGSSWFSIINLYGGPDSQINNKGIEFAAYKDRDSLWVIQHYGYTSLNNPLPSDTIDFVSGLNNAITDAMPNTDIGAYLNYVDPSLSLEEAHELYYGPEILERLTSIKKEYDPDNSFWNPQAITA